MVIATASQLKNAFGKYLEMVLSEGEVLIVRFHRPLAKIVAIKADEKEELEKLIKNTTHVSK